MNCPNFLARANYGSANHLITIKAIEEDDSVQKLISALLCQDKEGASSILSALNAKQLESFTSKFQYENLPGLLYERICLLELSNEFSKHKNNANQDLLAKLRAIAIDASLKTDLFEKTFAEINQCLGKLNTKVVWTKGAVMSRLVYERQEYRDSVDFDCIVEESQIDIVLEAFSKLGFKLKLDHPGYCNQFGVGPTGKVTDLFLKPHIQWEGCHSLTLERPNTPYVEIKFNPLESGLKMYTLNNFFAQSRLIKREQYSFWVPSIADHLLLQLVHWHKHGFQGWGWAYDINLLCQILNTESQNSAGQNSEDKSSGNSWQDFIELCKIEHCQLSAWVGLTICQNKVKAQIPKEVLDALKPASIPLFPLSLRTAVSPESLWNCNGLPQMLLNAVANENLANRLTIIGKSFFPDKEFLKAYYGQSDKSPNYAYYLALHWLLLIFPAGLIRRLHLIK